MRLTSFISLAGAAAGLCLFASAASAAGPTIKVTPKIVHPKSDIRISGSGFAPSDAVDIYLDTTDKLLVVTDAVGKFSAHSLDVALSTLPGQHWVTAVGRKNGDAVQVAMTVRTNWTQRGFSQNGKRFNPYETVIGASNAGGLDVAWKAPVGGFIASSPVYNGTIFVGSEDGKLYAFTSTGALKWSAQMANGVTAPPVIAGSTVFALTQGGAVNAFNTATGATMWTKQLGNVSYTSLLVAGGLLYTSDASGNVYALNAATGANVWTDALGGVFMFSGTVSNGVLYIGNQNNAKFYAIDAATGVVKWTSQLIDQIYATPAAANGMIYVGCEDDKLHALLPSDGTELWTAQLSANVRASPAVAYGLVYAASEDGNLSAFRGNTGQLAWTVSLGHGAHSSPAVVNGVVFIGDDSGRIYAFNALSGGFLWGAATGDQVTSSPTVADGMLLLGSFDKNLYAFEIGAGNDAAYRRNIKPPAMATLRPDRNLKPSTQEIEQ